MAKSRAGGVRSDLAAVRDAAEVLVAWERGPGEPAEGAREKLVAALEAALEKVGTGAPDGTDWKALYEETARELDEAREKNRELNRRAQEAEGVASAFNQFLASKTRYSGKNLDSLEVAKEVLAKLDATEQRALEAERERDAGWTGLQNIAAMLGSKCEKEVALGVATSAAHRVFRRASEAEAACATMREALEARDEEFRDLVHRFGAGFSCTVSDLVRDALKETER